MAASMNATEEIHLGASDNKRLKTSEMDPEEFLLRKRLPKKLPKRKNDVYVNNNTNFNAQISRCQKLLDSGFDDICVHGLGKAVNKAANVALELKSRNFDNLILSVNTSTIDVVDDLEAQTEEGESTSQQRSVSAIHIRVMHPQLTVDQAEKEARTPLTGKKRKRGKGADKAQS